MKQTIFETRQRAEELLKEAVAIWRSSEQSEYLEGIEKDPVFSLLVTALAYQANEMDNDIERLKAEVTDDFARMLVPYSIGHATPATVVVETALQADIEEMILDERSVFSVNNAPYRFIPLLQTRVLNASVTSIVRLDGRRWKVTLRFGSSASNLSGFAFAVTTPHFRDMRVSVGNKLLPLARPWDYADIPLSPCFSLANMIYNKSLAYDTSATSMDLFAKQDIRLFYIKPHKDDSYVPVDSETLDLIFEFSGTTSDFVFDKSFLSLNATVLVNAEIHSVNLSTTSPIMRIAGSRYFDIDNKDARQQFLHLLRPSDEQLYGKAEVEVRHIAADRFNSGALMRLLGNLTDKFSSDYHGFQQLKNINMDVLMRQLQEILSKMQNAGLQELSDGMSGVYLMLKQRTEDVSVNVSYLTTDGAFVNDVLDEKSSFTTPAGLLASATRQIASPVLGTNEVQGEDAAASLSRYYMVTGDRLVTPADIKVFCYNELMTRYSISADMVELVTVDRRLQMDGLHPGYEIVVGITLKDNPLVRRSFSDKIPQVEIRLQKMIEVRSTNIYPINVSLTIGG